MKLTKTDSYFPAYVLQTVPTDTPYYEVNPAIGLIRHENGKDVPFYAIDSNKYESFWRELKNADEVIEKYPDRDNMEWGSIRDRANPLNQLIRCYRGYAEVECLHRTREADEEDIPNEQSEIVVEACYIPSPMPGEARLIIRVDAPETWEQDDACVCLYVESVGVFNKGIYLMDSLAREIACEVVECIVREHGLIFNGCRERAVETLKDTWQVL